MVAAGHQQHPQLRADRHRGAGRRRRAQGRPVDRAPDPGLPRAAQGARHRCPRRRGDDERPGRRHLPQLRPGGAPRAGRAGRGRRAQAGPEGRRERARHRGDGHRDLQPGRDLRRGRPVPRLGRGAVDAPGRARRAARPRRCCRTSTSTTTTARSRTSSRSPPGWTRWRWARARSSARPATRCGCGQELGTVGPALNVLFQQALRVGKRSRAETDIDRVAPTLVGAALTEVLRRSTRSGRTRVLVVGAGAMAGLATATVSRLGRRRRSPSPTGRRTGPQRLATEYAATPATLADLPDRARRGRPGDRLRRARPASSSPVRWSRRPAPDGRADGVHRPRAAARRGPVGERPARRHPDRPGRPRRRAARVRRRPRGRRGPPDRHPGGQRLPGRAPAGQRHPDRGRAALDGDRRSSTRR